jgi:hypothetical protein
MSSFKRLDRDYDNLRSALSNLYSDKDVQGGLRLAAALGWYWLAQGQSAECAVWQQKFLTVAKNNEHTEEKAKAYFHLGEAMRSTRAMGASEPLLKKSVELWQKTKNRRGRKNRPGIRRSVGFGIPTLLGLLHS